jgi:dTDP-4-dehydrorhamnose 3,5-epimerase
MRFGRTELPDVVAIDIEKREDDRGFFGRSWDPTEFQEHGLTPSVAQINVGFSIRRGTLRGMHFQRAPHQEAKVVRCTRGAVFDVAVDIRPESSTYRQWVGVELTMEHHRMLYIPEGFAHGYLTLTEEAEVTYQTSMPYAPEAATGVRYDDPALGVEWPIPVEVVSEQDRTWPLLAGA